MCVYPNTEARSCNRYCSGKAISITYSECVSVALDTQHEMAHAIYCHLWPLRLYRIFPHYFINDTIFKKKKLLYIKSYCTKKFLYIKKLL